MKEFEYIEQMYFKLKEIKEMIEKLPDEGDSYNFDDYNNFDD